MVTPPIFDSLLGVMLALTLVHPAGSQGISSVVVYPSGQLISPRGTNFTLSCFLNTSLDTFLRNDINWIYVSHAEPERKEIILSERTALKVNESRYHLNSLPFAGGQHFNLTILNAMGSDDGRYICRLHKIAQTNSPTLDEDSVSVIIPNDVETVEIKLGDIIHGLHDVTVTCLARGGNPPAVIDISLNGKQVTDAIREAPQLEKNQSASEWGPRYISVLRTTIQVTSLTTIGCAARANYTGAKDVAARDVTFLTQHSCVIAPPVPQVGDVHVNISCEVLQDAVHVEDYAWEIKTNDNFIRLSSNYTESIYTTSMQVVNQTYTLVSLQLAILDKPHLAAQYTLLLYTSVGAEERYLVQLVPGDPMSGGATWTVLRPLWLALTLHIYWLCHHLTNVL